MRYKFTTKKFPYTYKLEQLFTKYKLLVILNAKLRGHLVYLIVEHFASLDNVIHYEILFKMSRIKSL